jgi:small subunit ribosomal protein S17
MAEKKKTEKTEEPEVEAEVIEPVAEEPVAEPEAEGETQELGSENQVPEVQAEPEAVEEASDTPVPDTAVPETAESVAPAKPTRSGRHVPRTERRTRTKVVREKPKQRKPITRTEKPDYERGRRQERRGVVVSDKGDKTIIVKVDVIKSHPKYKKVVRSTVKFHAHDEANTAGVGDTVRIIETRPLSKTKRWRLAEIVEKAR